jgi:hypothetical protein
MNKKVFITAFCVSVVSSSVWSAERFDPATQCTSGDYGEYPFDYAEIVDKYIHKHFFDPSSIMDLEIYKPDPSWFSNAVFKKTRNNTTCYWRILFEVNGKNKMGGYVGRKAKGLFVKWGIVHHVQEYTHIEPNAKFAGEDAYKKEMANRPITLKVPSKKIDLRYLSDELDEEEQQEQEVVPSYIAELKALANLQDEGIISEEEFQRKKTEILERK